MAKKSSREDGRGHWPRGKPRNDVPKDWQAVRARLERLLRSPEYGAAAAAAGEIVRSRRGLAQFVGVSDRQVRRWISGEDMPSASRVESIKEFMAKFG